MKKKVIYATIAAMSLIVGLYLSQSEKESDLSDLLTENVEALAANPSLKDCETYCTPDHRYYCIVDYGEASVSCPQHRKKSME